ncbi:MAG: sporulation protein YqfD [Clostridiaceae bacterium]|nr:sporulation protein YqfD [Clostridiaceae bacterium]
MREWYHYLRGYVFLRMIGLSPERFLNLCCSAGLELWQVRQEKDGCLFCMDLQSFLHCRPYARKSGVRLFVKKRVGLPFILHRNRTRGLWAAGVLAFFCLLFGLSLFLWDIEYQGNQAVTDSQLEHSLDRMGIHCGILKWKISCEELETALREEYNGITWVSARVSGTRLYVHIKENEVLMEVPKQEMIPCDLVAEADAVITRVVVRSGIPLVKPGDIVEKGQVLVTGRIPITDDSGTEIAVHEVTADADILGIRTRTEKKVMSRWHRVENPTGRKRSGLSVSAGPVHFLWMLPGRKNTEWNTVTTYRQAELLGDFVLPVTFGFIDSEEVSTCEAYYSEQELSVLASAYQSQVMENLMEKGVHIIENNVKILVNGSVCRFVVDLKTEEAIQGKTQQGEQTANEHN